MDHSISVLLPVFNGERTVERAIRSVLTADVAEVVVVNDGSSDSTHEIVERLVGEDDRVRHVALSQNLGLAGALNAGIDICSGHYIARMDADDESLADRFPAQLRAIEERGLDLIGGAMVGAQTGKRYKLYAGVQSDISFLDLMLSSALNHPTWFGKTSLFKRLRYRELVPVEDIDFTLRAYFSGARMGNIDTPLLKYWEFDAAKITTANRAAQILLSLRLRFAYLLRRAAGPDIDDFRRFSVWAKKNQARLRFVASVVEAVRVVSLKIVAIARS